MIVFCSSRRRHTRYWRDWSSDVCSSDLSSSEPPHAARPAARSSATAPEASRWREAERSRCGTAGLLGGSGEGGELPTPREERESAVQGESVDLGGWRCIKKQKKRVLLYR